MKKYLIIALAAIAFTATFTSCLKKPQKNTDATATETSAEKKVKVSLTPVEYKAPTYLTKDLAMQDLGGQVKRMEYTALECDKDGNMTDDPNGEPITVLFIYDINGIMTKGYAQSEQDKGVKLVRDKATGLISQTERMVIELDFTYINKFEYNPDGTIAREEIIGKEFSGTTTNTYKDGVQVEATAVETGDGVTNSVHTTFTVIEVDRKGNWTKRLCTSEYKSVPDDGSAEGTDSGTAYGIECRKIEYYK
ncbi:MAG: hypothetical protein MJZ74_05675 [Muribaculaceae bacterium]|nr:hypothetical protein [Muribaculaceae bacterium]